MNNDGQSMILYDLSRLKLSDESHGSCRGPLLATYRPTDKSLTPAGALKRPHPSPSGSNDSSPSSSSPPALPEKNGGAKRHRGRISDYDKLVEVLKFLSSLNRSVKDFLSTLCKNRARHSMRKAQAQLFDFVYVDIVRQEDFSSLIGPGRISTILRERGWVWAADALREEIKALADHAAFGPFQPPSATVEFGTLEAIKLAASAAVEG